MRPKGERARGALRARGLPFHTRRPAGRGKTRSIRGPAAAPVRRAGALRRPLVVSGRAHQWPGRRRDDVARAVAASAREARRVLRRGDPPALGGGVLRVRSLAAATGGRVAGLRRTRRPGRPAREDARGHRAAGPRARKPGGRDVRRSYGGSRRAHEGGSRSTAAAATAAAYFNVGPALRALAAGPDPGPLRAERARDGQGTDLSAHAHRLRGGRLDRVVDSVWRIGLKFRRHQQHDQSAFIYDGLPRPDERAARRAERAAGDPRDPEGGAELLVPAHQLHSREVHCRDAPTRHTAFALPGHRGQRDGPHARQQRCAVYTGLPRVPRDGGMHEFVVIPPVQRRADDAIGGAECSRFDHAHDAAVGIFREPARHDVGI
mmetsp:Transcript_23136/g.69140  ORF Transcript_23136/g.69140 Transcript_23136/m.69140 type:complete len:377 (+) Transcript_23136:517-1647(+)